MVIPSDWFGLGVVAALVVPGLVFGGVSRFLSGYKSHDKSVGSTVLRAVLVSIVFDTFYLALFGVVLVPVLADPLAAITSKPAVGGLIFGALALAVPALVALSVHKLRSVETNNAGGRWRTFLERVAQRTRNSVPTAWDWATAGERGEWVRIRIAEGSWVGGRWGAGSLASSYPERPELFLTQPWKVDKEGRWVSPLARSDGIWMSVEPGYIVIWEHSGPRTDMESRDG